MQLPEADYSRGMSSLGREGQGAISSLESQASSKLQEGALYPKWASAKAAIAHDVVQFAAEVKSWENARQDAKAVAALSEYHNQVAMAETKVASARTYKAADIPASVNIERFKKAPDGTDVERDDIEQWEAAPGMFDHYEKGFSEAALAKVGEGKAKNKLAMQIAERRTQGQIKMKTIHYKGSLEVMQNDYITSATNFANSGKPKEAAEIIQRGMRVGAFTLDESRKLTVQILSDGDETKARIKLLKTDDPLELQREEKRILETLEPGADRRPDYEHLTPEKRWQLAQSFDTKRIELEKAGMVKDKKVKENNNEAIIRYHENKAAAGNGDSMDSLRRVADANNMDFTDRQRLFKSQNAGTETTRSGKERAEKLLIAMDAGTMPPGADGRSMNRVEYAEYVIEEIRKLEATDQINGEYAARKIALAEKQATGFFDSKPHTMAEQEIKAIIGKTDSASQSKVYAQTINRYIEAMREESMRGDIKVNPVKWVKDNAPQFMRMRDDEMWGDFVTGNVHAMIVTTKTGGFDVEASLKKLEQGVINGHNKEEIAEAVRLLKNYPIALPTEKR